MELKTTKASFEEEILFYLIVFLFVISGLCGLVYEVVWTRMLSLIFGNTAYSVSTVLASFMGGLALGSWLAGRFIDKTRNLLRLYGWLELLVGVSALLVPVALGLLDPVYKVLFNSLKLSMSSLNSIKFVMSFCVFLVPAMIMGATLPVLSRALINSHRNLGGRLGLLYSFNTFGAVLGSFLTGFILIASCGIRTTTILAACLNAIIGAAALFLSRKFKTERPVKEKKAEESKLPAKLVALSALVFGVSGFVSLGYEVIWARNLAFIFTSSIYSFTVMLMVFLLGIASGSLVFSRFIDREKNYGIILSAVQLCAGLFSVLALFSFRFFYFIFRDNIFRNISSISAGDFLLTTLYFVAVIFPSTFFMGAAFPVVGKICVKNISGLGKTIGNIYFLNTVGAILGSLITGFILVPRLGGQKTLCLLALINILMAVLLALYSRPSKKIPNAGIYVLAGLAALFCVYAFYSVNVFLKTTTNNYRRVSGLLAQPVLFKEGVEASVTIYEVPGARNRSLWINSVPVTGDCIETRLMSHLPLALIKDPKRALVICFGMGASFKSALSHDINVDVVELVEPVVKSFGFFHADAAEVMKNPRGHVIINDGRNYVYLTEQRYDMITMDPSPPIYSAGTVNLYTEEFFKECRRILTDKGVICLWIPPCEKREFDLILKAFTQSFSTTLWDAFEVPGILVIGTKEKLKINRKEFVESFGSQKVRQDLASYTKFKPEQILGKYILNDEKVGEYLKDVLVMNDNMPYVEYPLFRRHGDIKDRNEFFVKNRSDIKQLMITDN